MDDKVREIWRREIETREALNTASNVDEPDEAKVSDLRGRLAAVGRELREALDKPAGDAGDDDKSDGTAPDAEARERAEIRSRCSLARYVSYGLDSKAFDGPEAEFAASEACPGMVPFAMFEAPPETRNRETRTITAAPSTVGINMHPTLPGVFLPAAATALRVDMPTVPSGTAAFPVLSTSLTAGARDKGVAGPETAAAIGVTTVDFKRVTGSFRIALEDIQKLDTIESTLTDNLAAVMSDAADALVVNGVVAVDNVDSAVPGFFSAANPLVTAATAASTAADFAAYVSAMAGAIDGKYARMPGDVSMLCAPEVIADAIATYSTTGPRSAYSELAATFRGVTATDRITPSNAHVSPAIAVRHSVTGRVAVSARWSGMQVIRDPYSDANKGEIILTAVMMMSGAKVLRGDVYKGLSFKTQ